MFSYVIKRWKSSQFERFHPQQVQMVNKTPSFKRKLIGKYIKANGYAKNSLMFNFPSFETADFLLQIIAVLIPGWETGNTLDLTTETLCWLDYHVTRLTNSSEFQTRQPEPWRSLLVVTTYWHFWQTYTIAGWQCQIEYKIIVHMYRCQNGTAPLYLVNLLKRQRPRRTRSSE